MPAVLFGSISTVADTSELQRRAFNDAFAEHGLDWSWSREDYRSMLAGNGGANRVAEYAASRGSEVDAAAVHATKSRIFQELVGGVSLVPRPGVVDTVRRAKSDAHGVALVTTTSRANVDAVLAALRPHLSLDDFDVVVTSSDPVDPKPDPSSYQFALDSLSVDASDAVAIEDNVGGVNAATAAGLRCIAFPNENTTDGDFAAATERVDGLDAERVVGLTAR